MRVLSIEFGVPIVFVGTQQVDAATIHLSPAKSGWIDFFDLSLGAVFDGVEAAELAHNPKLAGLHHFRPSGLTKQCPGIRCDGMHFNSDYVERTCRGSAAEKSSSNDDAAAAAGAPVGGLELMAAASSQAGGRGHGGDDEAEGGEGGEEDAARPRQTFRAKIVNIEEKRVLVNLPGAGLR